MTSRLRTFCILAGLIITIGLAIGFRLYDIKHYPPGLFPDEAANGEDVLLIFKGDIHPFYARGNGREALFFYLQAACVWLFGIGVWPMHVASAMVGIATVIAVYFATRIFFGRLAGLSASFLLATSHWHVTLSRTGFRAIMIPLFLALFTAFVGYTTVSVHKGHRYRALLFAALTGITFAGGFYTYIAYRIMVLVIGVMACLILFAMMHSHVAKHFTQTYWKHVLIGIVCFGITITPLAWYFWHHPTEFIGRAGQVSIFNPDLQEAGGLLPTLAVATHKTIAAFFAGSGDTNWRHNVAGFPLLNPWVGVLFLLGLAWLLWGGGATLYRMVDGREIHFGFIYPYILLLLLAMLIPVVTTAEGLPHGLRSLGLLFPIFFTAGMTLAVIIHWLLYHVPTPFKGIGLGILAGLCTICVGYDGSLYFLIARNDANAYYAYRGDLTRVAEYINDFAQLNPASPRPYLVLDKFSLQTVHYLTAVAAHDHLSHPDEALHKYTQVDPENSQTILLQPGEYMIFTQSSMVDADRYAKVFKQNVSLPLETAVSEYNRFGQEILRVYRVAPVETSPDGASLDA